MEYALNNNNMDWKKIIILIFTLLMCLMAFSQKNIYVGTLHGREDNTDNRIEVDSIMKILGDSLIVDNILKAGGLIYPTSDGTNGQAITTNGSGTLTFSDVSGYSVTNESNNRIVTSSGSGTGNAEANLTFDGTDLTVSGGDIELTETISRIKANTSDGSDNLSIFLAGGGLASSSRGGMVGVYGNEASVRPGNVYIRTGVGGEVEITNGNVTIEEDLTVDNDLTVGTGNTDITFGDGTGDADIFLNGSAGENRVILIQTNGSQRWLIGADNQSEGGSNAGSDFDISRYNDGGTLQGTPLTIERSSGDVTIANDLTVSGGATISGAGSALTVDRSLLIDDVGGSSTSSLKMYDPGTTNDNLLFRNDGGDSYINAISGEFGIGTSSPTNTLSVDGDADISGDLQLTDYGSGSNSGTEAYNLSVDASGNVIETSSTGVSFGANNSIPHMNSSLDDFDYVSTIYIDQSNLNVSGSSDINILGTGQFRIGTTSAGNGTGVINIGNGTAPTSSPSNMVQVYAEDVSSSSELKVRDEAGNVTTLSPHNFSKIPEGPSEKMAWSFYSERDGQYVTVDMLKLARLVEKLTGEKLVYTGEVND